jgi:hypothetical protein
LRTAQDAEDAGARACKLPALTLCHLRRARVSLAIVDRLPGSGKFTVAAGRAAARDWTVLRTDEIRRELGATLGSPVPDYGEGPTAPPPQPPSTRNCSVELNRCSCRANQRCSTALGTMPGCGVQRGRSPNARRAISSSGVVNARTKMRTPGSSGADRLMKTYRRRHSKSGRRWAGRLTPGRRQPSLTQCAVNAVAVVHCRGDAVQEMEEGALLPGPPGPTQRERGTKPLQGASVKSRRLERCRKRRRNLRQVCTTKMSESEPSDDASKSGMSTSEPGACVNPGTSLEGSSRSWPVGVRRKGGMSVVWALGWNSGTSRAVAPLATGRTGVRRGRKPKARVPDAVHWGGLGCSSDEGLVMRLERRPRASCWTVGQSGNQRGTFCVRPE